MVRSSAKHAVAIRDLRHRVLTCTTKLSDRDTHGQAVSELESIIPTLSPDTFSLFINSLSSTSTSDRLATRAASLRLLAALSSVHGPALSGHIPKLIAAVIRRLRDPDTAVRSAASTTTATFAATITTSPFSAILRPLASAIATEQDIAAQSAAALCLSAAVDASPEVDTDQIVKLLPKWMKLAKCDGFKAKSAILVLIRSAMRVCEIGNCNLVRDLVVCVMEFVKSEDWATRKAAVEALMEIAVVERDSLSEIKVACLKTFESRKFDKVKAVREAMTQMVEAWKEIPDVVDDGSPPRSQASSKDDATGLNLGPPLDGANTYHGTEGDFLYLETFVLENVSNGRYPARSKISSVDSNTPETRRKHVPLRRSSPSDINLKTTAGNRGARDFTRKKPGPSVVRKLDSRKPSGGNVVATDLHGSSVTPACDDNLAEDDECFLQSANVRPSKPNTRSLFTKNQGSQVVPYIEEHTGAPKGLSCSSADTCIHQKDCEDLSSIRKQLVQIENQQSSLMDLLQKYIGSSQDGMRSLETRVHGLELALDDISYDLAVSTARMSAVEPSRTLCCLLPRFSSKFWRRPDGRCSASRFSFSGTTPSVSAMRCLAENSAAGNAFKLENRRFRHQGVGGVIVNPLAEIPGDSRTFAATSSSRLLRNGQKFA